MRVLASQGSLYVVELDKEYATVVDVVRRAAFARKRTQSILARPGWASPGSDSASALRIAKAVEQRISSTSTKAETL